MVGEEKRSHYVLSLHQPVSLRLSAGLRCCACVFGAPAASGPPVSADPNIELVPIDDREQDKFLPIANISRIMKRALPANAKIAKDAKETVQECVSEFISFITSEASDKCQREKRKTIMGDDLLWAMSTLGFENYTEPLKTYLFRYREVSIKTGGKEGGDDAAAGGGAGGADGSGGGEDAASPKGSADDAGNS
eukprot:COSAG02_NODE_905_length_16042_cov_60.273600_6_plen_193_part_00